MLSRKPRVWLARTPATAPIPIPRCVRDDRGLTWRPGSDGHWHTTDGRHTVTWPELHSRTDLVEVG